MSYRRIHITGGQGSGKTTLASTLGGSPARRCTSWTWWRVSAAAMAPSDPSPSAMPWSRPSLRPMTGSRTVSISAGRHLCWTGRMPSCGWTTSARPRRPDAWCVVSCRARCASSGPVVGGSASCAWVTTSVTPGIWAGPFVMRAPQTTRPHSRVACRLVRPAVRCTTAGGRGVRGSVAAGADQPVVHRPLSARPLSARPLRRSCRGAAV